MTMHIDTAALRIAREVREAEDALTEVDTFTGQDALLRLASSQQSLLSAGNDLARVHGKLRDIAVERGDSLSDICQQSAINTTQPVVSLALAT